ncbi:MAG TPA: ABC transporter permease [Jiangellaceae bacterium]|nr:ABC transporter permease [Jiangellaceae bacterium]
MSTITLTEDTAPSRTRRASDVGIHRKERPVGFGATLQAEWIKIRTVRSTIWTLISLIALSVGVTALSAATAAPGLADGSQPDPLGAFLTVGLSFGQVAALVLGVLVISGEYGTGTVRSSIAAVPHRGRLVAAKALVLGSILLVFGTATAFAGFYAANLFFNAEGIGASLSDDGVLRAMFGGGLYLAVLGIFAMGIGLMVRHTAGALTLSIALIFVLGNVTMLLPGSLGEWTTKLMPGNAGGSVAQVAPFGLDLLDPWVGFAVFVGQAALLLLVGTWLFRRRDA